MQLRRFVPPIIVDVLRARRRSPTFSSYGQAARACGEANYEESALLRVIRRKTELYRETLLSPQHRIALGELQLVSAIGLNRRDERVRVVDFGGACGAHFFALKSIVGDRVQFDYRVVETRGMVNEAKGLENDELKFFESLQQAKAGLNGVDIVFSSGTLQCVPDPYKTLEDLVACKARFLILARIGMTNGARDVIVIHKSTLATNGPGPLPKGVQDAPVKYPFTFPVREKLESIITQHYRFRFRLMDPSGVFPVNDEPLVGMGYVAEHVQAEQSHN